MALKKYVEKLNEYYHRLDQGAAHKFDPSHVERVRSKLQAKEESLLEDIATASKPEKIERLQGKLAIARTQIKRANWLLETVSADSNDEATPPE